MHGIEVADPYVERLIESFCFYLPERRLSWMLSFLNLLSVFWTLSIPITIRQPLNGRDQLKPNLKEGDLTQGYCVPRAARSSPISHLARQPAASSAVVRMWSCGHWK